MIGSLFITGIPEKYLDRETRYLIEKFSIGGIILFSRNIEDPYQLTELCIQLQKFSIDKTGIPLFISIDQEGGKVSRLKPPFTQFPDISELTNAERFSEISGYEMRIVGINMDMAPVLDICSMCPDFLKGRTIGSDPEKVYTLGKKIAEGLKKNRIIPVLKHFPGLGMAKTDPHYSVTYIDIDYEELSLHIYPFRKIIEEDAEAIMLSHGIYSCLDPDLPASLSPNVVNLLRNELGFKGLIITDDMEMGAIKEFGTLYGAVLAFEAGVDLILFRSQQKAKDAILELKKVIEKNEKLYKNLLSSYKRIKDVKKRFLKEPIPSLDKVKKYFGGKRDGLIQD